jgi:Fe-Mn family superoxide dismutase
LAPPSQGGGELPSGALASKINEQYGSIDKLIGVTNAKLAGIQGSGWAWIVRNNENGAIEVVQTANQDTVGANFTPLVAIDAWEHAYYLQYQNVKVDYFKAIWNVINWKEAERRFTN